MRQSPLAASGRMSRTALSHLRRRTTSSSATQACRLSGASSSVRRDKHRPVRGAKVPGARCRVARPRALTTASVWAFWTLCIQPRVTLTKPWRAPSRPVRRRTMTLGKVPALSQLRYARIHRPDTAFRSPPRDRKHCAHKTGGTPTSRSKSYRPRTCGVVAGPMNRRYVGAR